MTNINETTRDECIDENKRGLLTKGLALVVAGTIAGTTGLATQALADQIEVSKPAFEMIPSQLGLDAKYAELEKIDSPIGALLSLAEQEWMQNAHDAYEDDTAELWSDGMLPQLASGEMSDYTIQDLEEFCPQFLRKVAVALDPEHPKYGGLWGVGSVFISKALKA